MTGLRAVLRRFRGVGWSRCLLGDRTGHRESKKGGDSEGTEQHDDSFLQFG